MLGTRQATGREVRNPDHLQRALLNRNVGTHRPQRPPRIEEILQNEFAVIERVDDIEYSQAVSLPPDNLLKPKAHTDSLDLPVDHKLSRVHPGLLRIA